MGVKLTAIKTKKFGDMEMKKRRWPLGLFGELLVNREEDVQDLRARGIISSAMSDGEALRFFKSAAPSLRIGDRYIEIAGKIQEYTQERWIWIAVHSFIYHNFKIIIAVLSVVGVLAGLFKTIMSLKQPQQS